MNRTALCRLCIRLYNEFINLFDDNDQSNEAYEIAVKYFDPILLKPQHEHDTTLICVICWSQINNFYNFQRSVLNAQVQLENNSEQYIPMIKLEDESWMNKITIIDDENIALGNLNINSSPVPELNIKVTRNQNFCSSNRNDENKTNSARTAEYEAIINKWKGVLECDFCHYKLANYSDLRQHFRQQHSKEKFYMICCNRKFYNRYDMVEHIRVHLNYNTFQCNVCCKKFSCKRNLNRHIRQVHIEKVQQVFELMDNSAKLIKPPLAVLKSEDEYKSNNKKTYFRPRGKINITQNSNFKIAGNLELRKHNKQPKYYQLKILSTKKSTQEYDTQIAALKNYLDCPICSKTFPYYTMIREHFQAEHRDRKFHIECCQRKFGSGYQIYEHFQLHKNPNVFKCEICEHTFSRSGSLTRHIRELHIQNVKWSCDHCGASFKSCSVLGRHKKRCEMIHPRDKVNQNKFDQIRHQKMDCVNATENYGERMFSNYTLYQITP